jgi:GH24 family phage-related lysozyme (muramidase)
VKPKAEVAFEGEGNMHASAQAAWQTFITGHEGNVAHMYLDTKGLVTIGIGNLIDPISLALTLPFQFKATNRA